MLRVTDLIIAWFLLRRVADGRPASDDIPPIERLKLARDREKIERDERRALEQRATTMLSVTVALAALGLAGLRQLVESSHAVDSVAAWATGPLLYVVITVFLLLRALTVRPPGPIETPRGEGVEARLARAERRSRAIAANNLKVVRRVRRATGAFSLGFLLLVAYAALVAFADPS